MSSYWDNPKSLWDQIPQHDQEDASGQQPPAPEQPSAATQPAAPEQPSAPEQPPAPQQLPPQQGRYQGLLSHHTIVIQQIRNFMADDFDILDTEGHCIGKIETTGGTLSRMFMGSRRLTVSEPDGTPVFVITDPTDFALDRYEVYYPTRMRLMPKASSKVEQSHRAFWQLFSRSLRSFSGSWRFPSPVLLTAVSTETSGTTTPLL